MPYGKHSGEFIPRLLFTAPHYIRWYLENVDESSNVRCSMEYFIQRFDKLPFKAVKCHGGKGNCRRSVTYLAFPKDHCAEPEYYCDECCPQSNALIVVGNYRDALDAVKRYYNEDIILYNRVVDRLLKAKGFSGKRTYESIIVFLGLEYEDCFHIFANEQATKSKSVV